MVSDFHLLSDHSLIAHNVSKFLRIKAFDGFLIGHSNHLGHRDFLGYEQPGNKARAKHKHACHSY